MKIALSSMKTLRKTLVIPTAILLGLMTLSQVSYAGDAAAGKEKSAVCAGCHGADGNSQIATNPRLAGQYEDYLVFSLTSYRSGERANPIMSGISSALSDEDIADLAAWFASQPGLNILNKDPM